jgi:YHS domain-containing protein
MAHRTKQWKRYAMQKEQSSMQDPVCGMIVDSLQYAVDYLGIRYTFCSEQCLERFTTNPHLYVGRPGHPAPKQEGKEVVKRRWLRLAQPLVPEEAGTLVTALHEMMGIKAVAAEGVSVEITYDLLQATAGQIEARLTEIGVRLGDGWAERLRRAFIHYEEECEVENLEVQEKRCHGPPP